MTAQLTDAASGYQLWSERFDRESADMFAVQDEIAAGVVEAVKARLAPGARAVPARPHIGNLEAYRSYLQGRYLRHTKNDHGGALRAFEEAIRLDPTHAPSWVGMAEVMVLAGFYNIVPARAACAKARDALATAHRLQGSSAESLYLEGLLAFVEGRWHAAEPAYRQAIGMQPHFVQALASFAMFLGTRGRIDEGLIYAERARQANPLAAFPCAATGTGLLAARRPLREAERFFEDAFGFEKENLLALMGLCLSRVAQGRFEEGLATGQQLVALARRAPFFLGVVGWALATAGQSDAARVVLEELRARPTPLPTIVSEGWLLAALGETDAAFDVLARAEEEGQAFLYFTGFPTFDPLRTDPRFGALLVRLGV